jgi:hypothetical protein
MEISLQLTKLAEGTEPREAWERFKKLPKNEEKSAFNAFFV